MKEKANMKKLMESLILHKDLSVLLENGIILLPSSFQLKEGTFPIDLESLKSADGFSYMDTVPVAFYDIDELKKYRQVVELFHKYGLDRVLESDPQLYMEDVRHMEEIMVLLNSYCMIDAIKGNSRILKLQTVKGTPMKEHLSSLIEKIRDLDQMEILDWSLDLDEKDIKKFRRNKNTTISSIAEVFQKTPTLWTKTTANLLEKNVLFLHETKHDYLLKDCGQLLGALELNHKYQVLKNSGFENVIEAAPSVLCAPFENVVSNVTILNPSEMDDIYPMTALAMRPDKNLEILDVIEEYHLNFYKPQVLFSLNPDHVRFMADYMIEHGLFSSFKKCFSMAQRGKKTVMLREMYLNSIGESVNDHGRIHADLLLTNKKWNEKYPNKLMLETVFQIPKISNDMYHKVSLDDNIKETPESKSHRRIIKNKIDVIMEFIYDKAGNSVVWKLSDEMYLSIPKIKRILCREPELVEKISLYELSENMLNGLFAFIFSSYEFASPIEKEDIKKEKMKSMMHHFKTGNH